MSRGLGQLQRRILLELTKPHEPAYRFATDIAHELFQREPSRSELVSIRRALASLAERRLVWTRFHGMRNKAGTICGLPWTRLPSHHDVGYVLGDCRCCPGGQEAFRATLDHAEARRILGLPPDPTAKHPSTSDLPPAGTRQRIPIEPLCNTLIIALKTTGRTTGRGSPAEDVPPWHEHIIADGWVPRRWATERIRRAVAAQYDVHSGEGSRVAAKVLRRLENAGRIEVGSVEREPFERGVRPHIFIRIVDKRCLGQVGDAKATHSPDPAPTLKGPASDGVSDGSVERP